MDIPQPQISRPRFLAGLGVGGIALAACSTSSEPSADTTAESPGSTTAGPGSAPAQLATTAEVPVGSGIIVDGTVVTQPSAGEFRGFSNICTHTGCTLNAVTDGLIACPCHGSRFNLDGSVARGPAARPLDAKTIVVEGNSILAE